MGGLDFTEIEPVERGISVSFQPAVITVDFQGMNEALDEYLADFQGMTAEALGGMTLKELKPLRADLNKRSKELNDARIAIKKQYMAAYEAFDAECKKLDERIKEPCRLIDEAVKKLESSERSEKQALLEGYYFDFCEANGVMNLAECVPFERLMKPEWLNRTFQLGKAKNELEGLLQTVLEDYSTVKDGTWFDKDSAVRDFFETLSVSETMRRDLAAKEAHDKAKALESEINANREGYTPKDETGPYRASQSLRSYIFKVSCTEEQKDKVISFFKELGLKGTVREQ